MDNPATIVAYVIVSNLPVPLKQKFTSIAKAADAVIANGHRRATIMSGDTVLAFYVNGALHYANPNTSKSSALLRMRRQDSDDPEQAAP
jgi:L-aminopeptidase/D-esterase-like protein